MTRKRVVVSQGHLYLFWTTGAFYLYKLCSRYDVWLVVPNEYRGDSKFIEFCEVSGVRGVTYYEYCGVRPLGHRLFYNQVRGLLKDIGPDAVIQHDYIGVENLYMFTLAKKLNKKCRNIVIQTSFPSNSGTAMILNQFLEQNSLRYRDKYGVPAQIFRILTKATKYVKSFVGNNVLPLTVGDPSLATYFTPNWTNNIDIVPRKILFDDYYLYHEVERQYLADLFFDTDWKQESNIKLAQFPVSRNHDELLNHFFFCAEKKQVVIFLSLIGLYHGKSELQTIRYWIAIFHLLKRQYPESSFKLKYHPSISRNSMRSITKILVSECPFIQIANMSERAIDLIMESAVIVGDTSTTLWWAAFATNKTVLSFDMKVFATSDKMSPYTRIQCFDGQLVAKTGVLSISDSVSTDLNLTENLMSISDIEI